MSMITRVYNLYQDQGCGICGKEGEEVCWFNPISLGAHDKCYKLIKDSEDNLTHTIVDLFDKILLGYSYGLSQSIEAKKKAVKAVMIACYPETILTYLQKNGAKKLTNLFNTVGVKAAEKYVLKNFGFVSDSVSESLSESESESVSASYYL